jgi:aerobic C4-dicarboxylate transport protein
VRKIFSTLYVQVLIGITLGGLVGVFSPDFGVQLKVLGDAFIMLLKMLIGPIIFLTVVAGISNSGSMKKFGRVGGKSLLYFETVSNLALLIGLFVVNLLKPGKGFNVDPATLDPTAVSGFAEKAKDTSLIEFLLGIIPKTFINGFTASGDILQILLTAILFGYAINHLGDKVQGVVSLLDQLSKIFFRIVQSLMCLAPVGAFGAMAFTLGKYGTASLGPLLYFMLTFYLTCFLFVALVLGAICWKTGFSLWKFLKYIREELLTVLGTSSSESVLAPLMEKLQKLGCSKSVVGLVVPTGYSFNLDGTNIYLTMAAIFIAQALNIDLSWGEQLSLLLVATLTSQGASGVTGAGFITLAATLAVVPSVPVAGMALILGIDRFMSEARAITNLIGNGVAAIVIAKWENEVDMDHLRVELNSK